MELSVTKSSPCFIEGSCTCTHAFKHRWPQKVRLVHHGGTHSGIRSKLKIIQLACRAGVRRAQAYVSLNTCDDPEGAHEILSQPLPLHVTTSIVCSTGTISCRFYILIRVSKVRGPVHGTPLSTKSHLATGSHLLISGAAREPRVGKASQPQHDLQLAHEGRACQQRLVDAREPYQLDSTRAGTGSLTSPSHTFSTRVGSREVSAHKLMCWVQSSNLIEHGRVRRHALCSHTALSG